MTNVMEVYNLLPKTNCKECGKSTCMAFAVDLLARKVKVDDCSPIKNENQYIENYQKLTDLFKTSDDVSEAGLIVHEEKCTGCGNCVVACPVNVSHDPKGVALGKAPKSNKVILRVIDGVVKSSNVHECRRFGEEKILCNACIVTCPNKAIEFV
ncbi:(Fe-S)-binding protein [Methanosalsum natronophilum]|uniref:4Fe-4S dicluster domain-containing protein n=1 Tax=Methanosalsum natronophilum TaxID=768733 RepID=A0A424YWX6_9EURY|nr:(Fe-S)-binding protein [Methanosalsum natronophilum]MCS3924618.1 4Fe-4S ferredoxin [Methanosalsum natronophilum]RQD84641.1 MAG: 4Fe-4S dicluster domain-containing protein [Methanosalsum natronophilum]